MTAERENFDTIAENLAEVIDDVLTAPRDRQRRVELIRHHVRRALGRGYKAGRAAAQTAGDSVDR
jgi:hypothetical protein